MTVAEQISLKDIGPIHDLNIPIEPGAIIVLSGRNGAGKSTALRAIESGVEKKNNKLLARDGRRAGVMKLPGITIKVGARLSSTGEATHSWAVVESGQAIEKLLHPGVKDPVAADKRRLEQLVALSGAVASDNLVKEFVGDDLYASWKASGPKESDLVTLCGKLKRWLHERARGFEDAVSEATGAIDQIGEIPDVPAVAGDPDALMATLRQLEKKRDEAVAKREASVAALAVIEELGDVPDVESLQLQLQAATEDMTLIAESLNAATQKHADLKVRLESAQVAAKKSSAVKAAIAEGVSEATITELTGMVEQTQKDHAEAVLSSGRSEKIEEDKQKLAELKGTREKSEASAVSCRELAAETGKLFATAIDDLEGWVIDDELRLCVEHARGVIPFSELSPGEAAIRAIELICKRSEWEDGEVPIVALPQEVFEGLDQENRGRVLQFAQERGICIVAAQATGGDLTCEVIRDGQ